MPYLKIQTSLPVSRAAETAMVNAATALLASQLQRPPESIVTAVESDTRLVLAGADDPAVFLEVKSDHLPPQGRVLSEALAELVHQHLGVPTARVYVKFVSSAVLPRPHAA